MGRGKRSRTGSARTGALRTPQGPLLETSVAAECELVARLRLELTPDLLRPDWRALNLAGHPMTGHCYVATEALYHLLGGKKAGWTANVLSFADDLSWAPGGLTHWWLEHADGRRLDATCDQFRSPVPYARGRRAAFVTNAKLGSRPSARTCKLLTRLGALELAA